MYGNEYDTLVRSNEIVDSVVAGSMLLTAIVIIILIPIVVLLVIGRWKMYKKAGKQGWEAIVPFYSDWVYVEISGLEWWWFFALVITNLGILNNPENGNNYVNLGTLIGLVGSFVCNYNISKKLHKDTGFAVLMTIFPFVLLPMIGFSDKYKWDNSVKVSKNGPFDDKKDNDTVEEKKETKDSKEKESKDSKFCPNCGNKLDKDSKFCGKCGKEI